MTGPDPQALVLGGAGLAVSQPHANGRGGEGVPLGNRLAPAPGAPFPARCGLVNESVRPAKATGSSAPPRAGVSSQGWHVKNNNNNNNIR